MVEDVDWQLFGATLSGVLVVVGTALAVDAAGLTSTTAFSAPLLVGVALAAGIWMAWR